MNISELANWSRLIAGIVSFVWALCCFVQDDGTHGAILVVLGVILMGQVKDD